MLYKYTTTVHAAGNQQNGRKSKAYYRENI